MCRVTELYSANLGGTIDEDEQQEAFKDNPELLETAWPYDKLRCAMSLADFHLRYYDSAGMPHHAELVP